MRLAWFRPNAAADAHPFDDTPALLRAFETEHELQVFTEANAHDFVWKHFRVPFGVCVFELDNTAAHRFIWPYLLGYAGVLLLRTRTLHDSRAHALVHAGRVADYVAEFTFDAGRPPHLARGHEYVRSDDWPMLRVPLLASRLAVVTHPGEAAALQDDYPEAHVRCAPLPVQATDAMRRPEQPGEVIFGVRADDRIEVARRAFVRACDAGARATLLIDNAERIMRQADVLVTLDCPGFGKPQTFALAAMGSAKPVVVLETEASADWPALDPQTWQPRGREVAAPVAVSVDLRDEEHSLGLAIRRLAADAALRGRLGEAGRLWWQNHATIDHAAEAWRGVLREAPTIDRSPRPPNWPAHLTPDGTEPARAILGQFDAAVDLW
jgi:hypothetical protein